MKVLVVGESWMKHTIHVKGFDSFQTSNYEEGAGVFLSALNSAGYDVTYVRSHEVSASFPSTAEALACFDVVVISDVGANTFLLGDDTFFRSQRVPNKLEVLANFVRDGGGLVMVGGYMSFTGIDAKARYKQSALADVLPVELLDIDDRVECPEGALIQVLDSKHPIVQGIDGAWPALLGYTRVTPIMGSETILSVNGEILLSVADIGSGRSVAFTSDLAPHWAPPEFLEWHHYAGFWTEIVSWASGG